jgi:mannose-1-phosphate guanylyltransferase
VLAHVPFIPGPDVQGDAPHPRVWAIVLTGDDPPPAGRGHRPRQRQAGRRWPPARPLPRSTRAFERASGLAPAGQMLAVLTRRRSAAWTPELDALHAQRVVQPVYRGRAAEALLPLLKVARQDPSATVVILPAEGGVESGSRFQRYASRAVWAVALRPELPILVAAHPHAPMADGWIEPGPPIEGLEDLSVRAVKRFVDDASPAERRRLFEGNALTSTSILVGRAGTLLEVASRALPEVLEALEPLDEAFGRAEEALLCEAVYECMPHADLAPLERAAELAVLVLPDVLWRSPERQAPQLLAS